MSSDWESKEQTSSFWEHHWGAFEGKWAERDLWRAQAICSMIPEGVTSVLEVGCGDGLIINRLSGMETMGIDISEAALLSVRGQSLRCTADDLPFGDKRYDLVIASEVLEHLPVGVYERSLSEIARVAGGYILISVPNRENLKANLTRCPACGREYHRNLHERSYQPRDLAGLFEGFETVVSREIGEEEPRRSRLEVLARRTLGKGMPEPWNTVCPGCGTAHVRPDDIASKDSHGNMPEEGGRSMVKRLGQLSKRHARPWLAALYERRPSKV